MWVYAYVIVNGCVVWCAECRGREDDRGADGPRGLRAQREGPRGEADARALSVGGVSRRPRGARAGAVRVAGEWLCWLCGLCGLCRARGRRRNRRQHAHRGARDRREHRRHLRRLRQLVCSLRSLTAAHSTVTERRLQRALLKFLTLCSLMPDDIQPAC